MAARLRAKGYSDVAIAKRMDISPNTVKNLLLPSTKERHDVNESTKMLKEQADIKGMIDVGTSSQSSTWGSSIKDGCVDCRTCRTRICSNEYSNSTIRD